MIRGHITVCKIYKDGTTELVLDKANLVTAGLGSSFLDIQQGTGSKYLEDYTPRYFQVGTGVVGYANPQMASSTFYQLSAPLDWAAYGEDTDISLVRRYRGFNASTADSGVTYSELLMTSAALSSIVFSGADGYFGEITAGKITRFFVDSFEAEIILDENSANGQTISEIGLFSKNPKGFEKDSPLLMAYKDFTPLVKTSEFTLAVHWSIGFVGLTTSIDTQYTGGRRSLSIPGNRPQLL